MQWLTEYVWFHEADNSRQKEQHEKMSDAQMFWSLCAECVEFLSQRRIGAVLMESRHGEGQTVSEKKDWQSVDNLYSICAWIGSQSRVLRRGETGSRLWAFKTSLPAEFWTYCSFSRICLGHPERASYNNRSIWKKKHTSKWTRKAERRNDRIPGRSWSMHDCNPPPPGLKRENLW